MSTAEKITDFLKAESSPYPTDCYAVPGSESIIDTINPETGLTTYFAKTLEQVRSEKGYAQAERMTIEACCQQKATRQHSPITWSEVTEEQYDEMFEVLPPIIRGNGFLVSEPWDHDASNGQPRYAAYRFLKGSSKADGTPGRYETASRPMTVEELRQS